MTKQNYRDSLTRLQKELKKAKLDGHPAKQTALDLHQDVQAILEHPGEVPFIDHYRLMGRMLDAISHFEASHPAITAAIASTIDALNKMGI